MTHVLNAVEDFADEASAGFVLAYGHLVRSVPGGVVRAAGPAEPKVAVVVGGGAGHYPAFAGWVGPGLADGAAVGNVFASPSTQQVCDVARAADSGRGVLLGYGNYAGDVLNFEAAAQRLRQEGYDVRSVAVSDDVASADGDDPRTRRGVAGDLVVLKVAGAAAEQGLALAEVAELAQRANARTHTLGVAFSGCTLPGAHKPLFTVRPGTMGVGMGVHGEQGLGEDELVPSRELAARLVAAVRGTRPAGAGGRAAVLLNGLGATKYEELFVLWGDVVRELGAAGVVPVAPEVGELVTSLDMAGVSLTVTWLDEDLEQLWTAPAHTPAFRRGDLTAGPTGSVPVARPATRAPAANVTRVAESAAARQAAPALLEHARRVHAELVAQEVALGDLDAVAGDGDHGRGMVTGAGAALRAMGEAVASGAGVGGALVAAGDAWAARAGGTSGALWGALLGAAGTSLLTQDDPTHVAAVARAVTAGVDRVRELGGAAPGDKTMVDAAVPFADTLRAAADLGTALPAAWADAAEQARAAAQGTGDLVARRGRARPHAERSLGHPDPGAVSFAHVVGATCP
ncbi:dihydroxyacetone kinase family protein [Cellulomonas avistercoris]|uniref:dihydroxyacetone kinase family protein n=1 Tax=Cellulomonas avistercoris TaxID=2762242 RepID=UPI001CD82205|nr:dihydroxyacetone kinase family protein [Cellulomonas avistercoris]